MVYRCMIQLDGRWQHSATVKQAPRYLVFTIVRAAGDHGASPNQRTPLLRRPGGERPAAQSLRQDAKIRKAASRGLSSNGPTREASQLDHIAPPCFDQPASSTIQASKGFKGRQHPATDRPREEVIFSPGAAGHKLLAALGRYARTRRHRFNRLALTGYEQTLHIAGGRGSTLTPTQGRDYRGDEGFQASDALSPWLGVPHCTPAGARPPAARSQICTRVPRAPTGYAHRNGLNCSKMICIYSGEESAAVFALCPCGGSTGHNLHANLWAEGCNDNFITR